MSRKKSDRLPVIYFLTQDETWEELKITLANLPQGCGVVFRHYEARDRQELAEKLAALCKGRRLSLFVSGDIKLAKRVKADGLYWPDFKPLPNQSDIAFFPLVIASIHHSQKMHRLAHLKIDAFVISPIFPTSSHPETLKAPQNSTLGPHKLSRLASLLNRNLIALGGINALTARRLKNIPYIRGVAGISLFK